MSAIRLTVVTTRPESALRRLLGVDAAPAWLRLVSEPSLVAGIPDGMRCIGIFFEARRHRSELEWAWIERRKRGGILGLDRDDLDGLEAWRARNSSDGAGRPDVAAAIDRQVATLRSARGDHAEAPS